MASTDVGVPAHGHEFVKYDSIDNPSDKWIRRMFVESGKNPEVPFVVTEKAHGANFSFHVPVPLPARGDFSGVRIAKRTSFLSDTDAKKFLGCQHMAERYMERVCVCASDVLDRLAPDDKGGKLVGIVLYGELLGGSFHGDSTANDAPIQKRMHYTPNHEFYCFDMCLVHAGTTDACVHTSKLNIASIICVLNVACDLLSTTKCKTLLTMDCLKITNIPTEVLALCVTQETAVRCILTCTALRDAVDYSEIKITQQNVIDELEYNNCLRFRILTLEDIDLTLIGSRIVDCESTTLCNWAARKNQPNVLEWARQPKVSRGCAGDDGKWWNTRSVESDEEGLSELNELGEPGACQWSCDTCDIAAANGHLDFLKIARANGCSWSHKTCDSAAANGHLGILIWAREHGCEWTQAACDDAVRNGRLDVVKYIDPAPMLDRYSSPSGTDPVDRPVWTQYTYQDAVSDGNYFLRLWADEGGRRGRRIPTPYNTDPFTYSLLVKEGCAGLRFST